MSLPVFQIVLNESDEMLVNSLVNEPAHRHYFIAQGKKELLFSVNEEKREITGVVIAANQPIYYYSDEIPECYIVFSPETVKKLALDFFAKDRFNLIDTQHDFNIKENAVILLQSYFTDDNNKSPFDVEKGSWIAQYRILDDAIWQQIKEGKIKGFSIAGNFSLEKMNFNQKSKNMNIIEKIKALIKQEEVQQATDIKTVDGKNMQIDGDLTTGSKLYAIADDGASVLAPAGDYIFDVNGVQMVATVDETGTITNVTEKPAEKQPTQQEQIEQMVKKIEELEQKNVAIEQSLKETNEALEVAVSELKKKEVKFKKPEGHPEKKEVKFTVL